MTHKNLKVISSESQLEKYGKRELTAVGCLVYKFVSPAKRGVPDDIVVCPDGYILFIEYKAPFGRGKLSKLQQIEIAKLKANNAVVLVIDSESQIHELVIHIKEHHA